MTPSTAPDLRDRRLADVPVVAVDLELTGLDPVRDEVVEIGVVRARGEVVEATASWLVRPGVAMGEDARRVTGLDDAALIGAPPLPAVIGELATLLEGAVWVGHRPELDHAHLTTAFAAAGLPALAAPSFDTMRMARHLLAMRSHALSVVCAALGVEQVEAHRALADARSTHAAFSVLRRLFDPSGAMTVGELQATVDALAPKSPLRKEQRRMLEEGLRARRTVWIDYVSRGDDGPASLHRREVEVWKVDAPRVRGFCRLRQEERVFRLERIREVQPGASTYQVPRMFGGP